MIQGTIIRVAGPVVDVQFAAGRLPALQEALTVTAEGTERTMEVAQHVNESTVRCIMPVSYTHLDVYKRQAYYKQVILYKSPVNKISGIKCLTTI